MAEFEPAFEPMLKHEGGFPGYANDRHDSGGETLAGISRRHWNGWKGWPIVDAAKKSPGFPGNLRENTALLNDVKEFYRRNFWLPVYNEICNQDVANWVFDKGVNMGTNQAHRLLQRALQIPDDGIFGKQTLKHTNAHNADRLLIKMKTEAVEFYRKLADKNPSQAKFLKSWMARV